MMNGPIATSLTGNDGENQQQLNIHLVETHSSIAAPPETINEISRVINRSAMQANYSQ